MKSRFHLQHFMLPATLLTLLTLVSSANAFTLAYSDSVEGWPGNSLTIGVNYANCPIAQSKLDSFIDQAMDLWNQAPGNRLVLKRGTSSFSGATTQSPPFISCEPNFSAVTGKSGNSVGSVGFAQPNGGNQLAAGYLLLNAESATAGEISKLTDLTLGVLIAHEIGHILGLGHSSNKGSLMYYDVTGKKTLQLSQDDIDGINFLYPRQELGQNGAFGCGSIQNGRRDSQPPRSRILPASEPVIPPPAVEMVTLLGLCALFAFLQRMKWKRFPGPIAG